MIPATFSHALARRPLDLPLCALLYARDLAYPDLDVELHLVTLDRLVAAARPHVPPDATPELQARRLATYLVDAAGFRGNVTGYDELENSFLNDVLERRLGIPITLAVIFMAVADGLGLATHGVGLPGHFLVGVPDGENLIYLDVFHGGRVVDRRDCEELVRETTGYSGPFQLSWLQPIAPALMLARMLNNVRLNYAERGDWARVVVATEYLRLAQPDEPQHLRDLAFAHYQNGSLVKAAHFMESYFAEAPDAPDVANIRAMSAPVMAQWARLN